MCWTAQLTRSTVTPEQKEEFRTQPDEYMNYRKDVESELNKRFKFVSMRHIYTNPLAHCEG